MADKLLFSKREAASALGLSVRTLEMLIAVREVKSIRVGRRRMVPCAELEKFIRRDHPTRSRKNDGSSADGEGEPQ